MSSRFSMHSYVSKTHIKPASEFLNIRTTQQPDVIKIDPGPYVPSILAKYLKYIGTLSYNDVPSTTEYMHHDVTHNFPSS